MKNIVSYIGLLITFLVIVSCEEDYVAPTGEPNHIFVSTSGGNQPPLVQINGDFSFTDLSRGVVSRMWTFPDGAVDILNSSDDLNSQEDIVHAIFLKPGQFTVSLHQEFADSVWKDSEKFGSVNDTTWSVTVLDSVEAKFQAHYILEGDMEGAVLDKSTLNELEAGEKIRFTQVSTGGSTNYKWLFPGGDPGTAGSEPADTIVTVKYKRLGTYDVMLIASRDQPYGIDTLLLEDYIKVIPSTKPVTLDQVYDVEDQIALNFSRSIDDPSAERNNFNVRIQNNGSIITPAITGVSLDKQRDNIVMLTLDEQLYNSDTVYVTYTAGNLATTDGIKAAPFTDTEVEFQVVNLVPEQYQGFEDGGSAWQQTAWAGTGTIDFTQDVTYKGAYSAHFVNGPGETGALEVNTNTEDLFSLEVGKKYNISYKVYVVSSNDPTGSTGLFLLQNWGFQVWGGPPAMTPGVWTPVSAVLTAISGDPKQVWVRMIGEGEVYMDDVIVFELEERP